MAGSILIDEIPITKAGTLVSDQSNIRVKEKPKYVSRGGLKLEKALNHWDIDVSNKVCCDIGSSTGGFTHCLLEKGAKEVYCIDSGTNQLHWEIRNHSKTHVFENTNAKYYHKLNHQFVLVNVISKSH